MIEDDTDYPSANPALRQQKSASAQTSSGQGDRPIVQQAAPDEQPPNVPRLSSDKSDAPPPRDAKSLSRSSRAETESSEHGGERRVEPDKGPETQSLEGHSDE